MDNVVLPPGVLRAADELPADVRNAIVRCLDQCEAACDVFDASDRCYLDRQRKELAHNAAYAEILALRNKAGGELARYALDFTLSLIAMTGFPPPPKELHDDDPRRS